MFVLLLCFAHQHKAAGIIIYISDMLDDFGSFTNT